MAFNPTFNNTEVHNYSDKLYNRRINVQSLVAIYIVTSVKVRVNPNSLEIVALVSPCE